MSDLFCLKFIQFLQVMISAGRVDCEGHLADEVYTGGKDIKRLSRQEKSSVPWTRIHTYGGLLKRRAGKLLGIL